MAWHDPQSALVLNRCEMYILLDETRAPRSQELCRLKNYAESPLEPIVVCGFPLRRLGIVWACLQTLQELQDGVFRTVTSRFRSIPTLGARFNPSPSIFDEGVDCRGLDIDDGQSPLVEPETEIGDLDQL